ncbi:MAG TPA: glutamate--tRNA ligase, partial [Acidobacteria bacterium]|nr:glutamate--tRNA ligase [Acidobacteriota bacterium]
EFEWALEQDHVVQRADGSCLYHLASAVDDHDFAITHVIRAVEHLSNTPRQMFISAALGYEAPVFAHLPYVAEPGSAEKLSKRKLSKYLKHHEFKKAYDHGAAIAEALGRVVTPDTFSPVVVDFYRAVGYEPDALVNYLLLLGWSLDDRTETFTREQMIEHFSLERVNRSPASFDPQKLLAFQERRMQALSVEARVRRVLPFVEGVGLVDSPPTDPQRARVTDVVRAAGERLKVAGDILNYPEFFQPDADVAYDEKAFTKRVRKEGVDTRLRRFRERLVVVDPFDAPTLDQAMHDFVATEGIGIGQIIHAVRVAATGKAVGFGLFEGLAILGRAACLARIDRALDRLA